MRSQRLHFAASPFPFGFSRSAGLFFFVLGDFSGDLYEFSCIGMTGKAVILGLGGPDSWTPDNQKQKNGKDQYPTDDKFACFHGLAPFCG
jgi:hypothetical protein